MAKRKTIGLIAFLMGSTNSADKMPGCANYDHYYGGCLYTDTCLVQKGKRCRYFEKAVLPTAADIGLKEWLYSLYQKHLGIELDSELAISNVRRCPDCGAGLKARQKYCDDCSKRRRQDSYRKARRKQRSKRNSL